MSKNISELEVGDKVFRRYAGQIRSFCTVERITKTQIILNDGSKWSRRNGDPVPHETWNQAHITPFTKEKFLEYQQEQRTKHLSATLSSIKWRLLEFPVLEKVAALLKDEGVLKEEEPKS